MITSNLKRLMEERKISIRTLVYETGISNMTILRARKDGIAQCRLSTLEVIADYLGCRVKDLFDERKGDRKAPRL